MASIGYQEDIFKTYTAEYDELKEILKNDKEMILKEYSNHKRKPKIEIVSIKKHSQYAFIVHYAIELNTDYGTN